MTTATKPKRRIATKMIDGAYPLCGAWMIDKMGCYRTCCLTGGHPGDHESKNYPYHASWSGVGETAKETRR